MNYLASLSNVDSHLRMGCGSNVVGQSFFLFQMNLLFSGRGNPKRADEQMHAHPQLFLLPTLPVTGWREVSVASKL